MTIVIQILYNCVRIAFSMRRLGMDVIFSSVSYDRVYRTKSSTFTNGLDLFITESGTMQYFCD